MAVLSLRIFPCGNFSSVARWKNFAMALKNCYKLIPPPKSPPCGTNYRSTLKPDNRLKMRLRHAGAFFFVAVWRQLRAAQKSSCVTMSRWHHVTQSISPLPGAEILVHNWPENLRVPFKPEFCLHGGRFFRLLSADVLFHQATELKF